jgi:hypothetical protein
VCLVSSPPCKTRKDDGATAPTMDGESSKGDKRPPSKDTPSKTRRTGLIAPGTCTLPFPLSRTQANLLWNGGMEIGDFEKRGWHRHVPFGGQCFLRMYYGLQHIYSYGVTKYHHQTWYMTNRLHAIRTHQ